MPGRRRTTDEKKRARGTAQNCRLSNENVIEWPAERRVPDPPDWLQTPDGIELWKTLAPTLFKQKLMTIADETSFAHLCQMHGEIADNLRRRIPATASQMGQLRLMFAEFGMTPASRSKVSVPESTDINEFSNNGE